MEIPSELAIAPELVKQALSIFIKEEVCKTGFKRVVLGLSGGIDSALSFFLAVEALGKDNVVPIIMPSSGSSADSVSDALACIEKLGVKNYHQISVSPQVETYFDKEEVHPSTDESEMKIRIGNKMARERMTILYDCSVVEKALVLGTSNKSEILLGYGTLYGDIACAINPLGDLYKMQVYQLSEYMGVPDSIITKPPTADLWAGQTDEAQLGFSYFDVDRLLYQMIDHKRSDEELVEVGFNQGFISKVRRMISASAFKSRLPVIAKLGDSK